MSRTLHTLSSFGFAAAAVLCVVGVKPWPAGAALAVVLLLICLVLQTLRDDVVAAEAARQTRELFIGAGR